MTTATIPQAQIDDAKRTDLIELAGRYTQLRKASGTKEWEGPCPKCSGRDRFHVKADAFFCRQCHEKFGDAIEFVQWMDGCDFVEAIEKLTGVKPMLQAPVKQIAPAPKPQIKQPEGWRAKAEAIVAQAHTLLMQEGPGADYLDGRGIQPHAWEAFNLGFVPYATLPGTWNEQTRAYSYSKQPAITIPWYRGGKLCAIRYRFLVKHTYLDVDSKEREGVKQSAMFDSDFDGVCYGGQALAGCAEPLRTLVLCEGELNAISIWQMAEPWNWDVLSLGSESAKLTPAMLDYAGKFERILVWMDKAEVAKELMTVLGGAYGISSPMIDGRKCDANELLQNGQLGEVLAEARYRACKSDDEKRRLLYNINDAITQRHMDIGACEVASRIMGELGIKG